MGDNMEENNVKTNSKINIVKHIVEIVLIIAIIPIVLTIYNQKLKSELENCYVAIKDNYDYDEFKKIISKNASSDFKQKAYDELNKALDEHNYIIRDGAIDNNTRVKTLKLLSIIEEDSSTPTDEIPLVKSKKNYCEYYHFMGYGKIQEERNIIDAYGAYVLALKSAKMEDDENACKEAKTKISKIEKEAIEKFNKEMKDYIQKKNYSDGYSYVLKYSEIIDYTSDEEVKKNYDTIKSKYKEIKQIEEEKEEAANAAKEAEETAKEKRRKKQEGVIVGMSKQDVLDSSWGKPIKKNITTTQYGTREQWVYPNYNYLYFENGKLTSIQTNE